MPTSPTGPPTRPPHEIAADHVALGLALLEVAAGARNTAAKAWLNYETLTPGSSEELAEHRQLAQARQAWAAASSEATAHFLAAQALRAELPTYRPTAVHDLDALVDAVRDEHARQEASDAQA